jgi:nucleoid DNA-binding protein
MDINKYIGKFLLKNKYCSLPGLGVFDLKKEGAQTNVSSETISAPVYKITFTPVGSIDDTFASFIATAENVSISNASNNIKEYCKNVKEELAKSGKYDIEFLGRFSLSNNKIIFHQSDD